MKFLQSLVLQETKHRENIAMRGRKQILLLIMAFTVFVLGGCAEKKEPEELEYEAKQPINTEQPQPAEEELPVETHEGQAQSKISGLWIDEEKEALRPYAIMLSNIKKVNPQSGISEAAVIYEALAEGGITRLMGIFEDFSAARIGSVRSARHYYASVAAEYDAIFVHYGETKYATSKIAELKLDNLSGLEGVGNTVFYRDTSIAAPHNAFASYEGILKGTEEKKYRTERKEDWENHYTFYDEDTTFSDGQAAAKVELGFSGYAAPYFVYNEEEKLYERFQFGDTHMDANTKEALQFKNIIIQLVNEWDIDKNGYQTMDIENSSGEGYYITNGKAVPVTWQKNESTGKMHYYGENGEILKVNTGKTYIALYPTSRTEHLIFASSSVETAE